MSDVQTSVKTTDKPIADRIFSFSQDTVTNPNAVNLEVNLDQMAQIIAHDPKEFKVKNYHKIAEFTKKGIENNIPVKKVKDAISPYKIQLPYFLFSGYMESGHNNKNLEYNGCIQIDFDYKEEGGDKKAKEVKDKLSKVPFIALAAISPSGMGVKALVATNNLDKELHVKVSKVVIRDLAAGLGIDEDYFDVVGASQPVYTPFDKDVYVNLNAEIFEVDVEGLTKEKTEKIPVHERKQVEDAALRKACFISYRSAEKSRGSFKNQGTVFLQSYMGSCLSFGVPFEDAINYLIDKGHANELTKRRVRDMDRMYSSYSSSFGQYKIKDFAEYRKRILEDDKDKHVVDKYLSEVDSIDWDKDQIIVAPTGVGKTYTVINNVENLILVVPTIGQVKEIASKYGLTPYYEEEKNISEKTVVTYSSLGNLTKNMYGHKEYTLVIDEVHNLSVAASPSFQMKQMHNIYSTVKRGIFKNVIGLTATEEPVSGDIFNDFSYIQVARKLNPETKITFVQTTDSKALVKEIASKGFTAVLLNNTSEDGELGRYKAVLEDDFKIATINSTMKHTEEFDKVVIEGDTSDIDVLISTTVIKEGISITEHEKEVFIVVLGNFAPSEVAQYSARFRNAEKVEVLVVKSPKQIAQDPVYIDLYEAECKLIERAEKLAELENSVYLDEYGICKSSGSKFKHPSKRKQAISAVRDYLIIWDDDERKFVVNYAKISNDIFNAKKIMVNKDLKMFAAELVKLGFNADRGILKHDNLLEKAEKEKIEANLKKHKEEVEKSRARFINKLKDDYRISALESLYNNETDSWKKNTLGKFISLSKYCEDMAEVVNVYAEIGHSDRAWSAFKQTEKIQVALRLKHKSIVDLRTKMEKIHSKQGYLTSDDFKKVFAASSKTKNTQLASSFFELKRVDRTINGKRKKVYTIEGDFPLPVDSTRFISYASAGSKQLGRLAADLLKNFGKKK